MDKKATSPTNPEAATALTEVINELLRAGAQPSDLAFCLAFMGLDLALHTSPSPVHATMLVTSALSHASQSHCPDLADDHEDGVAGSDSTDDFQGSGYSADCAGAGTVH